MFKQISMIYSIQKIVVHSTSDAIAMTDSDKPQFLNENNLFAYDMFNESLSFAF